LPRIRKIHSQQTREETPSFHFDLARLKSNC